MNSAQLPFHSIWNITHLLGGNASALVPCKVDAIVLVALFQRLLLAINVPGPAVLLAMNDCFLFGVELQAHVGERISTLNWTKCSKLV